MGETATPQPGDASVKRIRAPSGNRANDRFQAVHPACGWSGAYHSNRTIEGRKLAQRDAREHRSRLVFFDRNED